MLRLHIRHLKRVDIVSVEGRVDSSTAHQLDNTLKGLQEQNRYKYVLDFSKLTYISSAGLRVMVAALAGCKNHHGGVVLYNAPETIIETLDLVGFRPLFSIFNDLVDAVDEFSE